MTSIPGWKIGNLGSLCSIEIGGTPSRNSQEFWDEAKETSNHWVSIRDLSKRVVFETNERITDLGIRHSNVKLQKAGTVLLSFKLSIGRVAFAGNDLYTNEAIAGLHSSELDLAFLYYGLQQWDLLQNIDQAIKGVTLNKEKLKQIEFKYPISKTEQIRIAEILSTLDQAIEQTEAIIAKQQRIKTGLMQDLLTKGIDENGNIRSEATHQFKNSLLGRIPVEWEIKHLENVTSHIVDCPHTTPSFVADGFLVARTFNIKDGTFIDSNTFYVAEAEFKERIARLEPRAGDIIFTREAPVGEAFVITEGMRICLGQRTMLIRCNIESCVPDYLIEALYSPEMRIRFDQMVGGTTNPHLNVAEVRRLLILIPPVREQKRIYELLATTRKALNDAQLQKRKFYALKTGIMHDLLTGKVRVNKLLES